MKGVSGYSRLHFQLLPAALAEGLEVVVTGVGKLTMYSGAMMSEVLQSKLLSPRTRSTGLSLNIQTGCVSPTLQQNIPLWGNLELKLSSLQHLSNPASPGGTRHRPGTSSLCPPDRHCQHVCCLLNFYPSKCKTQFLQSLYEIFSTPLTALAPFRTCFSTCRCPFLKQVPWFLGV